MSDGTQVDIRELREALLRVLDAAEARLGHMIDLQADYYWTLDLRQSFDPHAELGSAIVAGQLADDVHELRQMSSRSDDPVIWHDLTHLVAVLRRIAALDLPDATAAPKR